MTSILLANAPLHLLGLHVSMKQARRLEARDAGNRGLQLGSEDGNTGPKEWNPANSRVSFEADPSSSSDEAPAWQTPAVTCARPRVEEPAELCPDFPSHRLRSHLLHSNRYAQCSLCLCSVHPRFSPASLSPSPPLGPRTTWRCCLVSVFLANSQKAATMTDPTGHLPEPRQCSCTPWARPYST